MCQAAGCAHSWLDLTTLSLVQPVELRARSLVVHSWLDTNAELLVQHV